MALFRRFLYSKRRDRHLENSDWVFVEASSSPASPSPPAQNNNNNNNNNAPPMAARDGGAAPSPPAPTEHPPHDAPPPGVGGPAARRSSLKPLHWDKVNRALEGSLWEELQIHGQPQRPPPEIDVSELEQLFSNTSPKIGGSKEAEKRKAFSSILEKVQLIDPLRANNTEIMLSEVKLPVPSIVDAVLAMDDTVLDGDQVENLLKFFPTKEEMEILKSYTGDQDKLGQCEQYFLELMKVPRMESKLVALMFKIQFNSQLAEVRNNLNTVKSACDEVRKSVKLKEVMKRILYLGNTLNQGTARGAAVGFKLDSLLKLTDTRASNSSATLMHYLCKLLATKSPELLDFHEDLINLEAATKIHLKVLEEEMLALTCGMKQAKQELDASANDGPVSTGFHMTLNKFIDHAEAEVRSVTSFYAVVGKSADGLALYFGEDPGRCPFEQATQTLLNFVRLFLKCHKENLELDELNRIESQDGDRIVVSPPPPPPPPPQPLLANVENRSMETCLPPLAVRDGSLTTSLSPPAENNSMETCLPPLAVRDGSLTTSLSPPAPPPAIQSLGDASTIEKSVQDGFVVLPTPSFSPPQSTQAPLPPAPELKGHAAAPPSLPGAPGPPPPPLGEHLDL